MNNLLLDEMPLIVLPKLATEIGLNESIVLQQVHYWLQKSNQFHDGHKWVYNSMKSWTEQFPFWSERTLKTIFKRLENKDLLITGNYNKMKFDRTKWYTVNYTQLSTMQNEISSQSIVQELHDEKGKSCTKVSAEVAQPIPEITRDYSEITKDICAVATAPLPYEEIISYLNQKAKTNYRNTKTNQKLIKPRFDDGFTLEDFKKVIDNTVSNWKGTKMQPYLRPSTLFRASKFESYLNMQPINQHEEDDYYE